MSERPEDHSDLMDRIYRHQRHIYDFTRRYYLFGRDQMIGELDLKPGDALIEIGCGTARNLVKIARTYPDAKLYGLDASHEMLKSAAHTVARAGMEDRITLAHGYAEALTPSMFGRAAPFQACLFSYSLSMIPHWQGAINAASRHLAADGHLHIVDFADLMGLGVLGRKAMLAWLGLFHVAPRTELFERLAQQPDSNLRFLPGRYAFLFSAGPVVL